MHRTREIMARMNGCALLHIRRAISPSRLCTFISGKRPGDTSSASFSESYRLKHRTTSWSEEGFWITSTSRHDTRTVTPRAPFEHYGPRQSGEAIEDARAIIAFVRSQMA